MEKTIKIDGKEVPFKSTAGTPLRYKAQFGKDYFAEIIKLNGLLQVREKVDKGVQLTYDDLQALDFEVFYNIAWTMAKTANPTIPDPLTWLDEFEEFPMMVVIPELMGMITSTLYAKKK